MNKIKCYLCNRVPPHTARVKCWFFFFLLGITLKLVLVIVFFCSHRLPFSWTAPPACQSLSTLPIGVMPIIRITTWIFLEEAIFIVLASTLVHLTLYVLLFWFGCALPFFCVTFDFNQSLTLNLELSINMCVYVWTWIEFFFPYWIYAHCVLSDNHLIVHSLIMSSSVATLCMCPKEQDGAPAWH